MRLKQILNREIEIKVEHAKLQVGNVVKIHGDVMLKGLKEGKNYIVTGIDKQNVTFKEANPNGVTHFSSRIISHPIWDVNEALKMGALGCSDAAEIMTETALNEAVDVEFKDIKPQHQKQIKAFEQVLCGKYIMIWDGIHGMIVDIKVSGGHGAYRFDIDTMRRLVLLKVRWVENDGDRISIGF